MRTVIGSPVSGSWPTSIAGYSICGSASSMRCTRPFLCGSCSASAADSPQ